MYMYLVHVYDSYTAPSKVYRAISSSVTERDMLETASEKSPRETSIQTLSSGNELTYELTIKTSSLSLNIKVFGRFFISASASAEDEEDDDEEEDDDDEEE